MKLFKKNIVLFIVFLLIISAGTTNVSANSLNLNENVVQESFSYIDFLKMIDLYVKSTVEGQFYIESPDHVKDLIRQNYSELQKIDFHKNQSPAGIYDQIERQVRDFVANEQAMKGMVGTLASGGYRSPTVYWWGVGYQFFSKSEIQAYINDLDYIRLHFSAASAAIVVAGTATAAAKLTVMVSSGYLSIVSNDLKEQIKYYSRLGLDYSWALIYSVYAI